MTRYAALSLLLVFTANAVQADPNGESLQTARVPIDAPSQAAPAKGSTVRKDADGWWFVSPDGERFFSVGVSVVDQGTGREAYNPTRPAYAAWRYYDTPSDWSETTIKRLQSWGFTTIGGWSDLASLRASREQPLWIMPVVHLGSQAGAPWLDMWDERRLAQMDQIARDFIVPLKDDPRVVGYYSDNEIGWWDGALWRLTFQQIPTSTQRQRLIQLLRENYDDDWNKLLADFEPEDATSWQQLEQRGQLWHRAGGNGIRVSRQFLALVAERYYELMRKLIRKYDPDALYLGDRFQSFYYPEVALACGRHADVVSTNLNASWNDGTFLRSYLDTLHAATKKPILVSEFYMAADENGSGNQNKSSVFPTVATQRERAEALANTVQALVKLPYVVGIEWFQYYDEPPHGRYDGEDFNFGLVDIHDQPYEGVTNTFVSLAAQKMKSRGGGERRDASQGVPPAPADPFKSFDIMNAFKEWDRERGFVPAATKYPTGDLYLCWSSEALYIGTYVLDVVDRDHYRDEKAPDDDCSEWRVRVGEVEPITVRMGHGRKHSASDPSLRVESVSGLNHFLRAISAVEIPASRLGKSRLKAGDQIAIEANYITHGRAHRIDWQGRFVLGE